MSEDTLTFSLPGIAKGPLVEAMDYINRNNKTDYELRSWIPANGGSATVSVSKALFKPAELFQLGVRYMMMRQTDL